MSPKRFQRLARFRRAVGLAREPGAPSWSEIALRSGCYDQAHLIRDFGEFAGRTPTELSGALLPADGGVAER